MTLSLATAYDKELPFKLSGKGPFPSSECRVQPGTRFWLPARDPRLISIHHGQPLTAHSHPALENLEGQRKYWLEHPDWMNMLDPSSPVFEDKQLELGLYKSLWEKWIPPSSNVLELGGGVGRVSQWLMATGCSVELVDPDLRSLWVACSVLSAQTGHFDLHWSTAEHIAQFLDGTYDVIVACELLNYVENPALILQHCYQLLEPGGTLLLSVEAKYGWMCSRDAAPNSIEALWNNGIVHVPHDRWVRTYDEIALRELLSGWRIAQLVPTHYSCSGPFEQAAGAQNLEQALALDKRLREHPVTRPWNRAWTVVAQKPTTQTAMR